MAKNTGYTTIIVETRQGEDFMGRPKVQVFPIAGQAFSSHLHVECSKSLITKYPLGTRFKIRAKLTDMEGTPFIYSYFGWPYEVVTNDRMPAKDLVK